MEPTFKFRQEVYEKFIMDNLCAQKQIQALSFWDKINLHLSHVKNFQPAAFRVLTMGTHPDFEICQNCSPFQLAAKKGDNIIQKILKNCQRD